MREGPSKPNRFSHLRTHPIFSQLDDTQFQTLTQHLYEKRIKKGQCIFREADERSYLYILKKGMVRVERYDETAEFCFLDFIKEEDLFPYGGLFNDSLYHFDTYAVSDVDVYYIATTPFEKICQDNLQQMLFLLRKLSQTLEEQERRLQYCLNPSALERIMQSLTYYKKTLGKEVSPGIIKIPYPLTIKEIATSSGTTRETVGQVIKQLKRKQQISYVKKMFTFYETGLS
ncbi:Crp/Fnr family transcriptional regulator [Isobaculum melis]|uniref:cAMP-binding domain of CRP or a regulatory subunit of cAMP-dependent protein kinases n=1 Tax=Isobaculum melis TaxID=142588 RepID=A0A1H9PVM7_9LACT|nr:Crp/Fnr family transcriptional regulator [Isobaculum melis]SER51663.1 cAMP-binding domain of CRP or a regulatory subunit of cAMP-dependent protein kinases [Isobaculum melis]